MLSTPGRGLRLALTLSLSVGYVAWHGHHHAAYAKGGDDEESDDNDDKDKGGEDEPEDEEIDKDQPPVTAGGLFTINSYPVRETLRPLTMTQGITQLKLSLGTDISAKGAFGTGGLSLEAIHGVTDNFSLIGGFTDAYNFKQYSAYFGFEAALAYDLVDIRVVANLHRSALALYCDQDPNAPANCAIPGAPPGTPFPALPDGEYRSGNSQFSIDLGFPFRYAINPAIAIVALQTLISIDFNGIGRDHDVSNPVLDSSGNPVMDSLGNPEFVSQNVGNGVKPDLDPSIGIATNPIAALSIVVFAQLKVIDFDTSAGSFQIPVTARVEFSPTQKLDVGLEFTLLNIAPPDPQAAIDNRFLSLFAQARF